MLASRRSRRVLLAGNRKILPLVYPGDRGRAGERITEDRRTEFRIIVKRESGKGESMRLERR
jgi:hypothetical protein